MSPETDLVLDRSIAMRVGLLVEEALVRLDRQCGQRGVDGWTYAVRSSGAIKIGKTTCLEQRLSTIQAANPCQIEIVALFHGVHPEKLLHRQFQDRRLHGEWFAIDASELPETRPCFGCIHLPAAHRGEDDFLARFLRFEDAA